MDAVETARYERTARLGDLTTLISSGSTPRGGSEVYLREGPVMLIRSQNVRMNKLVLDDIAFVTDEIDAQMLRSRVQRGDVLLNITGASIGRVATFDLADVRANVNQHVCIIRPRRDSLIGRYLSYFISSPEFQLHIDRLQHGGTRQALTFSQIAEFVIPLPSLKEQRRIAAILNKADELRAKRRLALEQLNALTRAIFFEVFGDPRTNPYGFPLVSFKDLFTFRTGKLDSNAAVTNGKYPFFTCSREDLKIDDYAFDCEALLLAGNNANADYSVKHYTGKFNAYQRTYVITLRNGNHSYEFARFVLEYQLAEMKRRSKGTNTKYLTLEILHNMSVPFPPFELQERFGKRIGALQQLEITQAASRQNLDSLFVSLQERAFRGGL